MNKSLSILYVVNTLRQTSSPLHEHVIPMSAMHTVSVCSYGKIETELPENVSNISGNGKLFGFTRALSQSLKTEKYDIVHFHAPHSASIALLYLLFTNLLRYSKTVYTVHNSVSRYNVIHLFLIFFIFLRVDSIVHCSQSSYDSFTKKIKNLFQNRRMVIANGVNLNFVDKVLNIENNLIPTAPVDDNENPRYELITIGRLVPVKNHSLLLESLAKLNSTDFRLQIIGVGPLQRQLEEQAAALKIADKVDFTGAITRDEVYEKLATSDLYISTSTLEGLPLSVLESLACGCPVILSDIPSHREVLDTDEIVTIVKSEDSNTYSQAIDRFLMLDSSEKKEIRQRGRQHVINNHSMTKMNESYVSTYKRLLQQ